MVVVIDHLSLEAGDAGDATTRFLTGITRKKIIGQQATPTSKVYVPPRGADPELGAATPIEVEVAQVNAKGKLGERLGPVGEARVVEVHALVLLVRLPGPQT